MNDSGKISSVHGVLHQYHPGGLIEVAPVAGAAGTGQATGMPYYPRHFPSSTQVPRTMRLDEYQNTQQGQGARPVSVHAESQSQSQSQSRGWGIGPGESKLRPLEEDGGQPSVNGLHRSKTVSGQKRNAFGDVKQSSMTTGPAGNGVARHRSRSIGSSGHESRIAALSIQLRNRLSHAAAKVERRRYSRDSRSKSPLQSVPEADSGTQTSNGNGSRRLNDSPESADPPVGSTQANKKQPAAPKLAPPVDIVSNGASRRRHPNPNDRVQPPRRNPPSYHRRYHSQQEFGNSKLYSGYPGTPTFRHPTYSTGTYNNTNNNNGSSDFQSNSQNSQSSAMEQDAIETLLFMSSPANSDFRPGVRQRQDAISKSIDSSMGSSSSGTGSSQPFGFNFSIPVLNSQPRYNGLEAQAGDEIDRMLDQMDDSDSEDERRFVPSHSRSRTLH